MVADFQYRSLDFSERIYQYQNQNEAFISMFNVVIHLGAILAVMVSTLTSSILSNRLRTSRKFVRLGDYG